MMHQTFQNREDQFVYQVEFNAVATGKIIAMSKRRIRWRYGFPNQQAVDAGESGSKCRGEEHDVTLIWSVASGKRMILSNGKQIYLGVSKSSTFEHQWTDFRGNMIRLVAHATSPVNPLNGRQYDLFVNQKSFFTLPKSYEIGLRGPVDSRFPGMVNRSIQSSPRLLKRTVANYSDSGRNIVHAPNENMDDLNRAIQASLQESREHLATNGRLGEESAASRSQQSTQDAVPSTSPIVEEPLIDLLSDPTSTGQPVNSFQSQNNTLVFVDSTPHKYNVDPVTVEVPSNQNHVVVDEFAPKAPSYNDVSNQILLSYNSPSNANVQPQQSTTQQYSNTMTAVNPFDTNQTTFLRSPQPVDNHQQNASNLQQHQHFAYH